MDKEKSYKCIECGASAPHLYQVFFSSLIKMTHCKNCEQVVDKYIEYDTVIIVLDLVVHRLEAYRHIIHNAVIKNLVKFALLLVLIEAYISWLRGRLVETIVDSQGFLLAAREMEFYFQIVMKCFLQLLLFTLHFVFSQLCGDNLNTGSLFRMLTITGFSRIFVLPALAWNIENMQNYPHGDYLKTSDTDYFYTGLCFLVTFTTNIQGLRALTNCSLLKSFLWSFFVCSITWILHTIIQSYLSYSDLFSL